MQRDTVNDDLKDLAFDFFYWFSRFEFALKENGLVRAGPYNSAQADWNIFISMFELNYQIDIAAQELLDNPPDVQVVEYGSTWRWAPLVFSPGQSDLFRITLIVKTIRNNLFHGGKHDAAGWDNPIRVKFLLSRGIRVLNAFAVLAGYQADYERRY